MVYFEWSMLLHRCGETKQIIICLFEIKKSVLKQIVGFTF